MGALADAVRVCREIELAGDRRVRISVYAYEGGSRLVGLLDVRGAYGTLLLNTRILSPEGRRFAMGWALAMAEHGDDGYYLYYRDIP